MDEKISTVIEIYKILVQYSDETHKITKDEIYQKLDEKGIEISDDTLSKIIRQLNHQLDIDIHVTKGRYASYQLTHRLFKFSELKLMIDAINSSSVIDQNTTDEIIKKLRKSASVYEAQELERNSTGVNKAKTMNEELLTNIDQIQNAFRQRCRIEFDYLEWTPEKKLAIKEIQSKSGNKHRHSIEPWVLFWCNDRYYLFGNDTYKKDDHFQIRNYRVDKMANIDLLEEKREGIEEFAKFDVDSYVAEHMGMFGSNIETFVVEIPRKLIGAFIDQYGRDIKIVQIAEDQYQITFRAAVSPIVLGWFVSMREVKLIKPESAKQTMKELLETNLARLEE